MKTILQLTKNFSDQPELNELALHLYGAQYHHTYVIWVTMLFRVGAFDQNGLIYARFCHWLLSGGCLSQDGEPDG